MIKQQRAIEDTLDRINFSYGVGRITKVVYTSFADVQETRPNKGNVRVQCQFGPERIYSFDIATHGNGKLGITFRGKYRIAKENQ